MLTFISYKMMQNDAGGRREDMEAELADLNNDIKELRNTLKALFVMYCKNFLRWTVGKTM